jgi:hypothetical protein
VVFLLLGVIQMKMLRVEYQDINLFDSNLIIDFSASDRVVEKEQVNMISSSVYLQKVIAFAGINATGKTTVLRLIDFAMNLLSDNTVLANVEMKYGIFKDNSKIIIDFIKDNQIYRLESLIGVKKDLIENTLSFNSSYYYKEETIYSKPLKSVVVKKNLFKWDIEPKYNRTSLNTDNLKMIKDNQSIIVLITGEKKVIHFAFIDSVNVNTIFSEKKINTDVYNLFDNNIKDIKFIDDTNFEIKYKNSNQVFRSNDSIDQYHYLSSGTIRGPKLIEMIFLILQFGGYLIIDEIEIHLNKTLIEVIIDFFKSEKTNPRGAQLIFSTHYLEILDTMDRKDNIYVTRKDKSFNLSVTKFTDKISRNDVKKSEILLSNYFENTAPSYEVIRTLKEALCNQLK